MYKKLTQVTNGPDNKSLISEEAIFVLSFRINYSKAI